jgi:hypothetical protein
MRDEHLSVAGNIASIVAIVPWAASTKSGWAIAALTGLVITLVLQLRASRHRRPRNFERHELIAEGNKLIRQASQLVVLFGRDLSWARDYQEAIQGSGGRRRVFVICQDSDLADFQTSAELLERGGARIIRTKDDLGIRATLIDSDQQNGGFLFVASKKASNDGRHRYSCKTYDYKEDWTLIVAMHRLFQSLAGSSR